MTSYNAAGLLREAPGAFRDHRLHDHYVTLGPEVELAGPIGLDLRLQRTNRGVLVRGRVSAPLRRTCARCLDPYVDEVSVEIAEEYLPSADPESGAPLEAPDEGEGEGVLVINAHHEIELDPVLHDELLLTEPMHPLCRPDCPGLCATCGQSLRGGTHEHGDEEIDPRLAELGRLLDDLDR